MSENRTLWEWLADWFAVRRATRLVVDGLLVLLVSGVVYLVWSLWVEMRHDPTALSRTTLDRNINLLFSMVHEALHYLGIVIVAVGCARIVADAIREKGATRSESTDAKP